MYSGMRLDILIRYEQNVYLNLIETNVLKATKVKITGTLKLEGINLHYHDDIEKIIRLQNRFLTVQLKEYRYQEFSEISVRLPSRRDYPKLTDDDFQHTDR
jgi:hypothetical protein